MAIDSVAVAGKVLRILRYSGIFIGCCCYFFITFTIALLDAQASTGEVAG